MNSCSREDNEDHREMVMKMNQNSSFSYGDAEALTDEVEEEYQFHEEVLRIKEILDKNQQESDSLLFDSLRKLRLMTFNVETLKATEIGKSVNDLRKHHSKEIRNLAKALVEDWKVMVDFWVSSTASIAAAAEVVTESAKTSLVEDEEGLPSPPMDEGAFFATPSSMELSKFFDEMDDDGNLQQNDNFNIKRESMTKSSYTHKDSKAEQKRNVDAKLKRHPVCPNESAPDLTKSSLKLQPKSINDQKVHNVKKDHENGTFPKLLPRLEEPALCNDGSVGMKLEAAKRKLHERYQEAENAKKKRTIQVVELRDLPKQNPVHRNQYNKPVMHRKQWHNTKW